MKVLELFAGSGSISKAFEARGHQVYRVDWDKTFDGIDLYADISKLTAQEILEKFGRPDVIWASPDCSTFSVMAISKHRRKNKETGELEPVTDYARFCDACDRHVLDLIRELQPKFYFIENPRAGMRKMSWMQKLPRYTVTYCQYGERRMKPTDIWTNHPDPKFKPPCKKGAPCHDPSPRYVNYKKLREQGLAGQVGGTQYSLKKSKDRAVIPVQLCEHIVDICEEALANETS